MVSVPTRTGGPLVHTRQHLCREESEKTEMTKTGQKVTQTEHERTEIEQKRTETEHKTTQTCHEIAGLERQTVAQLRARYQEVFGEAPGCRHKQRLVRRIAWRLQCLVEGDLSDRARERALSLARDVDVRLNPPAAWRLADVAGVGPFRDARLPPTGAVLTRQFRKRSIAVEVLDQGFRHEGVVYPSLSAVARQVTGTQWNGFLFFGLRGTAKRSR